nr:hypothetical protein [Tanacetum cinerariifolium]
MAIPSIQYLECRCQYKDAKTLFEALQARFDGNDATKKTQKTLLKQMYENFNAPSTESLDSIFNRLQKIVSQLAILGENISIKDLNMKFLRGLPSDTNEVDTTNIQVSTVSTPVSTVNTHDNTTNLSDVTVFEVTVSFAEHDSKKVLPENWECRSPRNQESRPRNQDNSRKTVNVEDTSSKAMVAIDGAGFDWSYMADDEAPTNMALMAFSDSEAYLHPQLLICPTLVLKSSNTLNLKDMDLKPVSDCDADESEVMVLKSNNVQHKPEQANQPRKSGIVPISTARQSSSRAATPVSTAMPINTAAPKPLVNVAKSRQNALQKSHSLSKRPFYQQTALKNRNLNDKIITAKVNSVNTVKRNRVTSVVGKQRINAVKSSTCWVWRPKIKIQDHVSKNSGSYIFKQFDYVDLEGRLKSETSPISQIIKNMMEDLLHLQAVLKEMCDKKNSVLFTENECLILSPDFKLPDESQVLPKVPRKNNMYSFDLKNVVPSKGLTCLFAKATNNDSNLWNMRLGHINFKTINKLMKGNLVIGLPSKIFENDHTCVACQKGKQHKASCKFDEKADEGFLVGYSTNSKAFRVYNSKTRKIEENLHVNFLKNNLNVAGNGPEWLFVIDSLTNLMNYQPISAGNRINSNAGGKTNDLGSLDQQMKRTNDSKNTNSTNSFNTASSTVNVTSNKDGTSQRTNDEWDFSTPITVNAASFSFSHPDALDEYSKMTNLEDTGIFDDAYDDRDEGAEADYNNLETMEPKKVTQALDDESWEVYVSQPPGFVDLDFPDRVYKVEKALYGLHQAPRACSIKKSLSTEFEQLMHKRFEMSSKGELTFFLGLQTVSTPMETHKPLSKDANGTNVDVHLYRSMIGSLMYLTSSSPDIMFAMCGCSRFQVQPKVSHMHAVKRIFRYLKGKPTLGLCYPKESHLELIAYSDSDYACASLDRNYTTGGCQFLGSRLISWQCKKQTIMANSTTKAEYIAASNCGRRVLWLQNQILDYGYNFMQTKIHTENESAICVVKNHVYHSKTKHIKIRHHFIIDSYKKRLIEMVKIHTDYNVADLLTKAFDVTRFQFLIASIEKSDDNTEFHQIVDFFSSCSINYALTVSPTIYASYIEQFWNTASSKTINSVKQIHDIADGKAVVISESSVRSDLLFDDEDGGDSVERAITTDASLEAAQDSDNIHKTQNTAMPNVDIPQGMDTGGSSRRQETIGGTPAQTRSERVLEQSNEPPLPEEPSLDIEDSPKQGRMIKEINKDENVNLVSEQGEVLETAEPLKDDDDATLAETLLNIKRTQKLYAEESANETARQEQEKYNLRKALELQKQLDKREEDVDKGDQTQEIDWNDPKVIRYHALQNRVFYKAEYEDIRPIFERVWDQNHTFVPKDSKIEKEVMKRSRFDLQQESSKKQKLDEQTEEEVEAQVDSDQEVEEIKLYMRIFPDEEIAIDAISLATKPLVIVEYKIVKEGKIRFPSQSIRSSDAIALDSPYLLVLNTGASQSRQHDSKIEKEVMKRSRFDLQQESSKKRKLDEQTEEEVEAQVDSDQEVEEIKLYMRRVPDEEIAIDAIPLATKPLVIVEYKIVKEGKISTYYIIRSDGSTKRYTSMINLLENINREDLETL